MPRRIKEITIDEWICEYLSKQNLCHKAGRFLEYVFEKCDKLVVRHSSPLLKKIWDLSKQSHNLRPSHQKIVKFFIKAFVKNSQKVKFVREISPINDECKKILHRKDIYLIETALTTETKLILTTDKKLKVAIEECKDILGIDCYLVDEFLEKYTESYS